MNTNTVFLGRFDKFMQYDKKMNRHSRHTSGFTLIELLVVIAIIGILSSIVLASLNTARAKSRDAKRLADVRQITNALELYHSNNGHYPQYTDLGIRCNVPASLQALVTDGSMRAVPTDPTNSNTTPHRLCYEYIGVGTASAYNGTSSWYCNGRPRSDYQYAIHFSTESATANYPLLTNSASAPSNEYKYCIPGPLR